MFLCIRKDGQIILFGGAERQYKMLFDVPPGGVSRAVWIDSVSGDFLVASPTAGVLRLFNAAQPTSKEVIKVSRHGILDIKRMSDEVYLLKLKNGQITQFNIRTRKALFTTEVGHTHQIQRTLVHPNNTDLMASAGFDGTLRKWDLKTMQMESMFEDRGKEGKETII